MGTEVSVSDGSTPVRDWPADLPLTGRWKVTGQSGSGVSSFLIDTVANRLAAGASPDGVLVVATSKESAAGLRSGIHEQLLSRAGGASFVAEAPLVRSVHSLAFSLLRQVSDEPIRLITGAEQDAIIRELLDIHAEHKQAVWPADVRPALRFLGFARQLRDLLLRAAERGQSPEDLEELGRRHARPLWTSAGTFLREYEQVMALSGTHRYSASELLSRVLEEELPRDWHTVVVDDAQNLDPHSAALIERIAPLGDDGLVVYGGNSEHAVFRFRGADAEVFENIPGTLIDLGPSRRDPARRVVRATSVSAENATVADAVRRAHLEQRVAWRDIAVIVRSTAQIEAVRRTLLAAKVPVHVNPTDIVLSEQHLVRTILLGLKAVTTGLTDSELLDVLLGPVGGADPVTLRRLIRGLRRFAPAARGMDTLTSLVDSTDALPDFGSTLTERELAILNRMRRVLDATRAAVDAGGSIEEVLWALWNATELATRLQTAALRGGATGSQADRDLDAVMALFDVAGDFVERHPGGATIEAFVRHVREQELPTGVRDRRVAGPDAVRLLTAHGSLGREFDTVVVAGVQEETWPSLGETGSLFGQEELLDLLDSDIEPGTPVSHTEARLQEERRLFRVATTRARRFLLVTCVQNVESNTPLEASRFIEEFAAACELEIEEIGEPPAGATAATEAASATDHDDAPGAAVPGLLGPRILAPSSLIAELRRCVCDPQARDDARRQAARQLARLAAAGVPGAHPDSWASTTTASTEVPLRDLSRPARLSPSKLEKLLQCPLSAVLGSVEDEDHSRLAADRGTLAHAYFEAVANGVDQELARGLTCEAFAEILDEPQWRLASLKEDFAQLLGAIDAWLGAGGGRLELVGTEVPVNVMVTDGVEIAGRIDRLDRDGDGAVRIVDLKTAASLPTKDAVQENLQLAAYQLALSRGVLRQGRVVAAAEGGEPIRRAGAQLLFPAQPDAKGQPGRREQSALEPEFLAHFAAELPAAVAALTGPELVAREGAHCQYCRISAICPVKLEGRVIINA
ncbi:DNA/RNA helicase, superfamily I [Corynebacterium uterequi]|uniref:DNA 3'-5' helicase n=1 Tax=Corynebacterium uterequi TaxID=1072256 RepID=A0A0G3HAZ5_9CORY|nr:DNA/RNA helicase, superfamily I [Corynebacterium uterequi]